jgi:hypothetical protein
MDVLHLPLGPVLSHWPPGLVVTLSLQGDVVVDVVVNAVVGSAPKLPHEGLGAPPLNRLTDVALRRVVAASRCDAVMSVLVLAGAGRLAGLARTTRDQLLDPAVAEVDALAAVAGLRRAVGRSWLLRWSLRDLAVVERPARLEGDVHARLMRVIDLAAQEARTGTVSPPSEGGGSPAELSVLLPHILVGVELATVRLAVASLVGLVGEVGLAAALDEGYAR